MCPSIDRGLRRRSSGNCCMPKAWWSAERFWACQAESCSERDQNDEVIGCGDVYAGQTLLYSCPEPAHPRAVTRGCSTLVIVSGVTSPTMKHQFYCVAVSCHAYTLGSLRTNAPQRLLTWRTSVESTCYRNHKGSRCNCLLQGTGWSRLWSRSKLVQTRRSSWARLRWSQTPNRRGQHQIGNCWQSVSSAKHC